MRTYQRMDDISLSLLVAEGDTEALGEAFTRMRPRWRRILRTMNWDPDTSDDIISEAALRALKGIRHYHHQDNLEAWISKIIHNMAIDTKRKEDRMPYCVSLSGHANIADRLAHPERAVPPAHIQLAYAIIDYVDDRREEQTRFGQYMQIVHAIDVEGLRYQQVADGYDLPLNTVKTKVFRGREHIRERFTETFKNPCLFLESA